MRTPPVGQSRSAGWEEELNPSFCSIATQGPYPTEEQARWRIIELLEVGFRPRHVATLLAIQPAVVYHWKRRFAALGLLGFTTQRRVGTPLTTWLSVQVIIEVFPRLDNHPLLGHDRVKMALDSLGYRHGHTTVWQLVARRLSANASRRSHYHARQRITRLLGEPRPAIAPSAPAAPPWQRASGPARPLRRACRRSGRRR
jgi:transposase